MRESIGNAFLFNVIIVFTLIIILLLVGSLSYSKAFRVKNRIVEIIEKYKDYNMDAKTEIEANLKSIGYKTNPNFTQKCSDRGGTVMTDTSTLYRYCIVKFEDNPKGVYFGVTSYMYFEIPVIHSILEFPIYGETAVLYDMVY